jgi:hypothetical protein
MLTKSPDQEIQLTTLRWIDSFFDISPEEMLPFVPRLLSQVLPAVSNNIEQVRAAANRVNNSLKDYIDSTIDDEVSKTDNYLPPPAFPQSLAVPADRRESAATLKTTKQASREQLEANSPVGQPQSQPDLKPSPSVRTISPKPRAELDYDGCVNALTLQFLNEHVDTRVAALGWLIMLHHKAPRKVCKNSL